MTFRWVFKWAAQSFLNGTFFKSTKTQKLLQENTKVQLINVKNQWNSVETVKFGKAGCWKKKKVLKFEKISDEIPEA